MEPALDERGDYAGQLERAGLTPPQWSPLSTSGATRGSTVDGRRRSARRNGARSRRAGRQAHSRKHEDQAKGRNGARSRRAGRPVDRRQERHPGQAAMEPALDERGDARSWVVSSDRVSPQWSPLSTSGATSTPCCCNWPHSCRNGARSRRAGRPRRRCRCEPSQRGPQWSPLSTSGATVGELVCPDWRDKPQWSPLSTSGATSLCLASVTVQLSAAMEPALDERGDPRIAAASGRVYAPQWSPLSTSGATCALAVPGLP